MADSQITGLTAVVTPATTDEFVVQQSGDTQAKKITNAQILAAHEADTTTHGISAFGATLVDDADASTARTTLELGTAAVAASGDFESAGSVATHAALTSGVHGITAAAATVLDDTTTGAMLTTLGAAAASHTHAGEDVTSGTVDAARLGVMTGDSGAGGAKGAVPAPAAGDAAAGKMLKADGTWAVPSGGSGDVVGPASSVDDEIALFSGTGGKTIKRASVTGIAKLTSGVLSAATAGTDYIANAAPPSFHLYTGTWIKGWITGSGMGAANPSTIALVADTVYYVPFFCPRNCSVVRDVQIRVSTGVASTGVHCAIYPVGSDGLPAASIIANSETGELTTDTTNQSRTYTPGSTLTLTPGAMYFAAFVSNGAPTIRANAVANSIPIGIASSDSNHATMYTASFTYGTLPSTPTTPTAETNATPPALYLRFDS